MLISLTGGSNYRAYMGRHLVFILERDGKKGLIQHLEDGYVGNKREGYKKVKKGDRDIVQLRLCWSRQK